MSKPDWKEVCTLLDKLSVALDAAIRKARREIAEIKSSIMPCCIDCGDPTQFTCSNCGKPLCTDCAIIPKGTTLYYCEKCSNNYEEEKRHGNPDAEKEQHTWTRKD